MCVFEINGVEGSKRKDRKSTETMSTFQEGTEVERCIRQTKRRRLLNKKDHGTENSDAQGRGNESRELLAVKCTLELSCARMIFFLLDVVFSTLVDGMEVSFAGIFKKR